MNAIFCWFYCGFQRRNAILDEDSGGVDALESSAILLEGISDEMPRSFDLPFGDVAHFKDHMNEAFLAEDQVSFAKTCIMQWDSSMWSMNWSFWLQVKLDCVNTFSDSGYIKIELNFYVFLETDYWIWDTCLGKKFIL